MNIKIGVQMKQVTISVTFSKTYNLDIPESEEKTEEYLETLLPITDWDIDDWCYIVEE